MIFQGNTRETRTFCRDINNSSFRSTSILVSNTFVSQAVQATDLETLSYCFCLLGERGGGGICLKWEPFDKSAF